MSDSASTLRKKIVVVGTGYVGLPAALMLAKAGHDVVGVDIDENVVAAINEGVLHINEEKLAEIMESPEVEANLSATHLPVAADVFVVAVPTPLDRRKKVADLSYLIEAVESIVPVLAKGNLVIIESTIPPLTCREILTPILEKSGLTVGTDVHIAHCPERILPGNIFEEIVTNDRIIGSQTEEGRRLASAVYESFVEGELFETDDISAELCKLVENTYRDVNIALANEVAAVAEELGVDGSAVIHLANRHPRVDLLQPGIGVGGHCIPIDPWFIKQVEPENSRLIFTARLINEEMPRKVARKIRKAVADLQSPKIVALGATYKPNTYDMRESPALEIIELLRTDGYDVTIHDPITDEYRLPGTLADIAEGADLIVLLVPHSVLLAELDEFHEEIIARMRTPRELRF